MPNGHDGDQVYQTVMFTDIENSVSLTGTLGQKGWAEILARHGQLFREALGETAAAAIENTGDGLMARFEGVTEAVAVGLRFQWLLRREKWQMKHPLKVRVGIHRGEMLLVPAPEREMPKAVGVAVSLTARVMGMADGGQVLLTREVFDEARQSLTAVPGVPAKEQGKLGWEAHGAYFLKGVEGAQEVFEVGERGYAPFRRPRDGVNTERSKSDEEKTTLGWRPAAEMEVPKRPGWRLVRKLGQGGFGEVWLAEHREEKEQRVFKFCFDVVKLRSFQRESKLVEFIRKSLGPREDIAKLYDIQLESAPYFLESAYCNGGTLDEWLARKMQEGEVPQAQRLAIMAKVARALAAAHSVGIIHKDVKPSNIFIEEFADGRVQPKLADFGIGELAKRAGMDGPGAGTTGIWEWTLEQMHSGTQMYCPPEYRGATQASVLGDIYSFGVVLYQVVIADFERLLVGDGWRRDVPDGLLAEDIAACVDVDPKRRLSSAALVAERLETLEQRRAELVKIETAAREKRELEAKIEAQRKKTRLAVITISVAAVLIAALGGLAFVLARSRNAEIQHSNEIAATRYREDMISAIESIDKFRGEAVRELIKRYKPEAGQPDRRGWEWYVMDAALNPEHQPCVVSRKPLRALAVSPDEKNAALGGDDGEVSIWSCDKLEKVDSWQAGAAVRSMAWKGEVLAVGLENGEVVLWEPATKRERRRWKKHAGAVSALSWNPVRDELTTGGADGRIQSWQGDGTSLTEFPDVRDPVQALAWETNGERLVSTVRNPARLQIWKNNIIYHEFELNRPESVLAWRPGHNEVAVSKKQEPMTSFDLYQADGSFGLAPRYSPGASAFAWAPDGMRVAVGGIDGKILILNDRKPPEILSALYGHDHQVTGLHWLSRDRLLSIGEDGTLRAWDDLRRSPHVVPIEFNAELTDAQWHPDPIDGRLAVFVAGDEALVLDAARNTERVRLMLPPKKGQITLSHGQLAWSPNGEWLAAACPGRGLIAWSMKNDERREYLDLDATDIRWLHDNRTLLVHTRDGWSRVSVDGPENRTITDKNTVWLGELGNGDLGQVRTVGGISQFSILGEGGALSMRTALPRELGAIHACALDADRIRLAVGGESGAFLWLDTRNGHLSKTVRAHASAVQAIGWHPNGTRLVTASSDGTCRIFDVAQLLETWVVEHQLPSEVVAASWSPDGQHLMLASTGSHTMRIYSIVHPSKREAKADAESLLAAINKHPEAEAGWAALAQALDKEGKGSVLKAAANLGVQARFAPLPDSGLTGLTGASPIKTWREAELPRAVLVAQACALEQWDEVVTLCSDNGKTTASSWLALARAEALAHLGRKKESEAANLEAWQALRREHGCKPAAAPPPAGGLPRINLDPFSTARPQDDWTVEDTRGNENNYFYNPNEQSFPYGDFVLLAGKTLRLSAGRMLPRSTGWIPLNAASRRISTVIAACNVMNPKAHTGTCIGSIFLLRANGQVVRIPLIFGRNIWRWWVPKINDKVDPLPEAPQEAIAWPGTNPRADYFQNTLALYYLKWSSEPNAEPVVAISISSTMRQPAPLLMSVESQP